MDWQQVAATSAVVIVTNFAAYFKNRGRIDKQTETIVETQLKHGSRLDEHDDRFEQLNKDFVPRNELNETFRSIRRSQGRQERMLEHVLFQGRPPQLPAPAPGEDE